MDGNADNCSDNRCAIKEVADNRRAGRYQEFGCLLAVEEEQRGNGYLQIGQNAEAIGFGSVLFQQQRRANHRTLMDKSMGID
jgi:hypothetical protein